MYINKAAAKACDEILKNGICQQVLLRTVQITIKIPPHIAVASHIESQAIR